MLLCFVHVGFWIELPVQRRLCPIFVKIMDPDKWDIIMRYRVTQYPRFFRRLTVGQRTPGFWGVTVQHPPQGETIYKNHGDRSSYSEQYLPCITIYQVPQHKPLNLMNKPYVYLRSKLNDISQNNNNNLKCTKPYEKISY